MAKDEKKGFGKRFGRATYAAMGAFAVGFFPTYWLKSPVVSIVLAACVAMPVGGRSASVVGGAVRGLGVGIAATFGIVAGMAMAGGNRPIPARTTETLAAGVIGLCVVVCALFAWTAMRRNARLKKPWDEK